MPRNLTAHTTLFLLLLLTVRAFGQTVSIHAMGGVSHCELKVQDYYATNFQKLNPVLSIGVTGSKPLLQDHAAAYAGLSIEGYGLRHVFSSAASRRSIDSRLAMGYLRVEVGFKASLGPRAWIGVGFGGSFAVATAGTYALTEFISWVGPNTYVYTNRFGRIQRPFIPMVGIRITHQVGLLRGQPLSLEAAGWLGLTPIFRSTFGTPFQPGIAALSLGMSWEMFAKSSETP